MACTAFLLQLSNFSLIRVGNILEFLIVQNRHITNDKYFNWNVGERRSITLSVSNNLLNGREVKFRVGPSLQSVGSLYFEIFSLSDIEILDTNNIAQSCHVNIRTNSLVRKNYIFLTFALHRGQNTNKYFPVSLLTEKLLQNSFSKQMSCYIVMRMKIRYKNIIQTG